MSDSMKDISKFKVADLKRELKIRGLSTAGNKQELQDRLQIALQDDSALLLDDTGTGDNDDILNEDDVLADEDDSSTHATPDEGNTSLKRQLDEDLDEDTVTSTPAVTATSLGDSGPPAKKITLNRKVLSQPATAAPSETEKIEKPDKGGENTKVVKISSVDMKERLALRAAKFGEPTTVETKKQVRAARFGASASSVTSAGNVPEVNVDLLKRRAERFGIQPGSKIEQVEMEEKKKKRLERFGSTSAAATNGSSKVAVAKPDAAPAAPKPGRIPITAPTVTATSKASGEDKKKLRAERFKTSSAVPAK